MRVANLQTNFANLDTLDRPDEFYLSVVVWLLFVFERVSCKHTAKKK